MSQGGSFFEGFASNAMGAGTGLLTVGTSIGSNIYLDTLAVATVGGLASEITGGKFLNGAMTAAFANLFNKWTSKLAATGAMIGGGTVVIAGGTCIVMTNGACVAAIPQGPAAIAGGAYVGGYFGSLLDDTLDWLGGLIYNESGRYIPKGVREQVDQHVTDSDGVMHCEYCGDPMIPRKRFT